MATGAESMRLNEEHITRLAEVIPAKNMESIAERYLYISPEAIINTRQNNPDDQKEFNRDILRKWTYKNPDNQRQVR